MNIPGFAVKLDNSGYNTKEETAVISYCILNKIPYKYCNKPKDRPLGFIPCGGVEWCGAFLPPTKKTPNYYPEFLSPHLYRKVWVADSWPLGRKVFIKPLDEHKRFTGKITSGSYNGVELGPFWCSEIVEFINEWRYYVADGKILTGEWYSGDEINTPDAPELKINIPDGYCGALDFGRLTSGELALVEANAPYACGWYGKNDRLYAEWLIKGWEWMMKNLTL
jgi:hypothetical protein